VCVAASQAPLAVDPVVLLVPLVFDVVDAVPPPLPVAVPSKTTFPPHAL